MAFRIFVCIERANEEDWLPINKNIRTAIIFAISAALITYAFWGVGSENLYGAITGYNPVVAIGIILMFIVMEMMLFVVIL